MRTVTSRRERRPIFVTIVPLLAVPGIVIALWNGPWTPWRVLGLLLLVPGLALLTIARINLGDAFSVRPEATRLVTTGLYSRIRNPIYVFGMFVISGLILYLEKPLFLLLLVPLVVLQFRRAQAESRVLEARFGDEYRRYRAQTWF